MRNLVDIYFCSPNTTPNHQVHIWAYECKDDHIHFVLCNGVS